MNTGVLRLHSGGLVTMVITHQLPTEQVTKKLNSAD